MLTSPELKGGEPRPHTAPDAQLLQVSDPAKPQPSAVPSQVTREQQSGPHAVRSAHEAELAYLSAAGP